MMVLRESESAYEQHKASRGVIKDYSLKHKVTIEWDFSDDSVRDQIFKLTVGENTVVLDAEEMMRYLRWV
jgi:hypothetical protein